MDAEITTDRLLLRPFTEDDADALFAIFRRPEVARWSGSGEPMVDRQQAVDRIAGQPARVGEHPGAGIFAIVPLGETEPVGMTLLVPLPPSAGVERHDFEIGWHLHPETWGRGYATESARAMIARAAEAGMPEVYAVTDPSNERSQAVCRRLGMTDLGLTSDWYDRELRAFRLAVS